MPHALMLSVASKYGAITGVRLAGLRSVGGTFSVFSGAPMKIEAGRAREGTAHLDGLIQHDDDELGEPKIVPPSALTAENEAFRAGGLAGGGRPRN